MSNARRWMRWIQYGALAIVVGAIVAEFLLQDRFPHVFAVVERGFMLLVVGAVGFGVLGLGWQALSDLSRSPTEGVTGQDQRLAERVDHLLAHLRLLGMVWQPRL